MKTVCLVLCAALIIVMVPRNGFAAPVDKQTAADPQAVLQALDAMNLEPMPDELATELRGEVLPWAIIYATFYAGVYLGIAWYKLYPYALWCSQNCMNMYELSSAYNDAIRALKPTSTGGGGSW